MRLMKAIKLNQLHNLVFAYLNFQHRSHHFYLIQVVKVNIKLQIFIKYLKFKLYIDIAEQAVKAWYKGSEIYDYNNPGFSQETGLFTQIVWKNSIYVGFQLTSSKVNDVFKITVTAYYLNPGNVMGEFENNVFPPRKN